MNHRHIDGGSSGVQEESEYGSNLLIEDYPLMVLPKLAQAIGLEESIVVQQIYWLLKNPNNGKILNGSRWIFNTYEEWRENYFPFWSIATVQRIFNQLESMFLLNSCQPEGGMSRRKHYTLNRGMVKRMMEGKIQKPKTRGGWKKTPSHQIDVIVSSNCGLPSTETTSKTSLSKESLSSESAKDLESAEKMRSLEVLKIPKNIPSEREFEDYIESEDLLEVISKRPNLYAELVSTKWRIWNPSTLKWKPVSSWRGLLKGLNAKLSPK